MEVARRYRYLQQGVQALKDRGAAFDDRGADLDPPPQRLGRDTPRCHWSARPGLRTLIAAPAQFVGSIACSCARHLTWRCECGAVTYGPALAEGCSLLDGPASGQRNAASTPSMHRLCNGPIRLPWAQISRTPIRVLGHPSKGPNTLPTGSVRRDAQERIVPLTSRESSGGTPIVRDNSHGGSHNNGPRQPGRDERCGMDRPGAT